MKPAQRWTALYRAFDSDDHLLYVGISERVFQRAVQHEAKEGWQRQVSRIDVAWFPTRVAALEAEREVIRSEEPLLNRVHNQAVEAKLKRLFDLTPAFVTRTRREAACIGPEWSGGGACSEQDACRGEVEAVLWRWFPRPMSSTEIHEELEPPFCWRLSPLDVFTCLEESAEFRAVGRVGATSGERA